jgi:hypothetical protein
VSSHFLVDVIDPLDRRVTLTPETWNAHAARRPEIRDSLPYVEITLKEPDFIELTHDGAYRYYRLAVNPSRSRQYLHVLVRMGEDDAMAGRVASVWYTPAPEGGPLIWLNPNVLR